MASMINTTRILLLAAIGLSSTAAFYSISGLISIFAAAPVAIGVMGVMLEFSKLVVTGWLYRNWSTTGILLKTYFIAAIAILMLLTSLGTYGFLSRSHADSNLATSDMLAQLQIIDDKIQIERDNIDASRKTLAQLDSQVNETISRTSSTDTTGLGIRRSVNIRKAQTAEREQLQDAISRSQANIARLNEQRAPIAAKARIVEAEVGPIKYIAQLIYGQDATDQASLESAIRWVIILIVTVFDPLAVLMFIAVNQDIKNQSQKKIESDTDKKIESEIESSNEPEIESSNEPVIESKADKKIEWERDRKLIPTKDTE